MDSKNEYKVKNIEVAIIGASGFVGKLLTTELVKNNNMNVTLISRSLPKHVINEKNLKFIKADLFKYNDCQIALKNIDVAIYLVHSMKPTAKLDQGHFADYDLILADNFINACQFNNVKQVIYLSGVSPKHKTTSPHLKSRKEIEEILSTTKVHSTNLRAGLIVGPQSSSFQILVNLLNKMPILLLPSWTSNFTLIADSKKVIQAISSCINSPETFDKTFNICSQYSLTYVELFNIILKALDKNLLHLKLNFSCFEFMKILIPKLTKTSHNLTTPLIESLAENFHIEESKPFHLYRNDFLELIKNNISSNIDSKNSDFNILNQNQLNQNQAFHNEVRSVQRIIIPEGYHADSISFAYIHWIVQFLSPFLKMEKFKNKILFYFWLIPRPLLVLEHNYKNSSQTRQTFTILGGLLARSRKNGRLEFREILAGKFILVAIHDYRPALPWWLYTKVQAPLHSFIIWSFNRWLLNIKKQSYKQNYFNSNLFS